jgi:hypothetical protein
LTAQKATVVAAGNGGNKTAISAPACIPSAIAVGNSTKGDANGLEHVYTTSNYGSLIDLMAPGSNITAAVPRGSTCTGAPYCKMTGTSMAAPHVAGAFAILKQAKPTAKPIEIERALHCSGKTVEFPEGNGLDKPRIDLLGAYNWLLKPPDVTRDWDFEEGKNSLDWTPLVGAWRVRDGRYEPPPPPDGMVFTSTANCNRRLEVVARVRRVYASGGPDDPEVYPNAGVVLKGKLDYQTREVSGYFFGYNYFPRRDEPNRGWGFIQRVDKNLQGAVLCWKTTNVPVNFRDWNTIKAVSNGASHRLYINGKFICQGTDETYDSGPVGALTGFSSSYPTTGGTFALDSVTTKSMDTAAPSRVDRPLVTRPVRVREQVLIAGNPFIAGAP